MNIVREGTNDRSSKIVKHNGVVYLSGQVGEGDSIEDQSLSCLERVDTLLKQAGSSRESILQATIWLSDMSYFADLNTIWNEWVPTGYAPARACGEAKLAREILKVEVIITAAIIE